MVDRRRFASRTGAFAILAALGTLAAALAAGVGRAAGGTGSRSAGPTLSGGGTAGAASTSTSASAPTSSSPPTTASPPTTVPASPRTTAPPATTEVPPTTAPPPTTAAPVPQGTRIGAARVVPVGGAASFQDPSSGDPSLVIQPRAGTYLAFDAVCPHAGCSVQYDAGSRLFVCPCHGSEFNATTGDVEVGPASSGLTRITIELGSDGQLYVS